MKHLFIVILPLLLSFPGYSKLNQNDLCQLIQVWAYLRYHAPDILNGEVDWDKTLDDGINRLENYKSNLQEVTDYLIQQSGKPNEVPYTAHEDEKSIVQLGFLESSQLTLNQRNELKKYRRNFKYIKNKFYRYDRTMYIVDYRKDQTRSLNEHKYFYHRVLTISKFWSKIKYFYSGKYKMKFTCDEILKWAINNICENNNNNELERILINLNHSLSDAHALHFRTPSIKIQMPFYHYPLEFGFQDDELYLINVYSKDIFDIGLKIGDKIVAINGESTNQLYHKHDHLFELATKRIQEQFAVQDLAMYHKNAYSLQVQRGDQTINFTIPSSRKWKEVQIDIPDNFGLIEGKKAIYPHLFKRRAKIKYIDSVLSNFDTVVVDLRNFYSTHFFSDISPRIVKKANTYKDYKNDKTSPLPGTIINYDSEKSLYQNYKKDGDFDGFFIVLVDNTVGSQPEIDALSFKLANSVIVGTKTWGTAEPCTEINIAGADITTMMSHGIFYINEKDNIRFDHSGVPLDYEIDYSEMPADFTGNDWFVHQMRLYIETLVK